MRVVTTQTAVVSPNDLTYTPYTNSMLNKHSFAPKRLFMIRCQLEDNQLISRTHEISIVNYLFTSCAINMPSRENNIDKFYCIRCMCNERSASTTDFRLWKLYTHATILPDWLHFHQNPYQVKQTADSNNSSVFSIKNLWEFFHFMQAELVTRPIVRTIYIRSGYSRSTLFFHIIPIIHHSLLIEKPFIFLGKKIS